MEALQPGPETIALPYRCASVAFLLSCGPITAWDASTRNCTRFGSEAYTLKGDRLESCWNGRLQLSNLCTNRRALTYDLGVIAPTWSCAILHSPILGGYEPYFHQATGMRVPIVRTFVPVLAVLRCVLRHHPLLIS